MSKEIIVNIGSRETRLAILENSKIMELFVEREERIVGSIYKGRVANVLPGMDASFVDIGLERNAFLYVGDIIGGGETEDGHAPASVRRSVLRNRNIKDLVKVGQEILVQVTKGPRGTKGCRVSTKISLPGRYVVLTPEGEHLGVSRKIADGKERDRLKRLGRQIRPDGFGLIIRTEAEDKPDEQLVQDIEWLQEQWGEIAQRASKSKAPCLVHRDYSLLYKAVRDMFGADVDRLVIDDPDEYKKAVELADRFAPRLKDSIELYDRTEPVFDFFNLEQEIERLSKRQVYLKSGGYLVIDETEALTTIDVNSGRFTSGSNLQDTILRLNLEAVDEVARQLRLRDLGGMIIIDFVDMDAASHRNQVTRALEKALKRDRARTKISHISPLGLIEMTRKRTGESVVEQLAQKCPYCNGKGRVLSGETVSMDIERELMRKSRLERPEAILVQCNPQVAEILVGPEGDNVEELEHLLRTALYVRADAQMHIETYHITAGSQTDMDRAWLGYRKAQMVECDVTESQMQTGDAMRLIGWSDGYLIEFAEGLTNAKAGLRCRARLMDVRRSFAIAEAVPTPHLAAVDTPR